MGLYYVGLMFVILFIGVLCRIIGKARREAEQRRVKRCLHIARFLADLVAVYAPGKTVDDQLQATDAVEQAYRRAVDGLERGL